MRPRGTACVRLSCRVLFVLALAAASVTTLSGQIDEASAPNSPPAPTGPPVTVTGVVLNAASGQPLPRALVRVGALAELGALTDGAGRFTLHGVPGGLVTFTIAKPGFDDPLDSYGDSDQSGHRVNVAAGMPELSFSLTPRNAISGHVSLSTGVPGVGALVTLVRQTLTNGRTDWDLGESRWSNPDGSFRFGGLSDGVYLLMTQPQFDNSIAAEPRCNAAAPTEVSGYAATFYESAPEMAGAARITVAGGQTQDVQLILTPTKFHLMEASVTGAPAAGQEDLITALLDHTGQQLQYPLHRESNNSICVYLPDGSYTLMLRSQPQAHAPRDSTPASTTSPGGNSLLGILNFSMEGRPAKGLRVALAPGPSTPISMRYEPGPPAPAKANSKSDDDDGDSDTDPLGVSLVRANAFSVVGERPPQVEQTAPNAWNLNAAAPGSYWVQVTSGNDGECVGAVTSGGQSLATTPWIAGPLGAGMPIEVVLRTDCAKLTVQLSADLAANSPGESATRFVYAVPDFDSMEEVFHTEIAQSGDRSATLPDMPPGTYRVFAMRTPQSIEFRNPAALARLGSGQMVTLEPNGTSTLVLQDAPQ